MKVMQCIHPACEAPAHYELLGLCIPHTDDYFRNPPNTPATGTCLHCSAPVAPSGGRGAGRPRLRCPQHRREFESIRQASYRRLQPERHPESLPARRMRERRQSQNRRYRYTAGCLTTADLLTVLAQPSCFYCGSTDQPTIDHKMPLSRGGTHDLDNLCRACLSCNSRKRAMTSEEYISSRSL